MSNLMSVIPELYLPLTKEGKRVMIFKIVPIKGKEKEAKTLLEKYVENHIDNSPMPNGFIRLHDKENEFIEVIIEGSK